GVDVAGERVDLLAGRRRSRAGRCGRPREADGAEVVRERLERIACIEADGRGVARSPVSEPDVVIEELAPDPAPLRDVVLGEEVLTDVVEKAVADVSGRRPTHD